MYSEAEEKFCEFQNFSGKTETTAEIIKFMHN